MTPRFIILILLAGIALGIGAKLTFADGKLVSGLWCLLAAGGFALAAFRGANRP